jgi:hypothetical protein
VAKHLAKLLVVLTAVSLMSLPIGVSARQPPPCANHSAPTYQPKGYTVNGHTLYTQLFAQAQYAYDSPCHYAYYLDAWEDNGVSVNISGDPLEVRVWKCGPYYGTWPLWTGGVHLTVRAPTSGWIPLPCGYLQADDYGTVISWSEGVQNINSSSNPNYVHF